MSGRRLWLGLAAMWAAAAALLSVADPARPDAAWEPAEAALGGFFAGAVLVHFFAAPRRPVSTAAAVTLAVSAGAEEVVWRWFATGELASVIGPLAALALTSLAFGAAHPSARGQHVVTGATFGSVYLGTGSLLGAWAAHCTYNLALAALAGRAPPTA